MRIPIVDTHRDRESLDSDLFVLARRCSIAGDEWKFLHGLRRGKRRRSAQTTKFLVNFLFVLFCILVGDRFGGGNGSPNSPIFGPFNLGFSGCTRALPNEPLFLFIFFLG